MKESIGQVCNGCWAIVMASLRMLLLLGTLLFLLFSIILLSHSTHFGNSLMTDPNKASSFFAIFYINNGANCLIALAGLIGLTTNKLVLLKAFPNMLFATTIMMSLFLIYGAAYTSDVTHARNEYMNLLNTYMSVYDWTSSSSPDSENYNQTVRATEAWDAAQSERCCGIDGYKDWDKHRPANVTPRLYPKSCCPVAHSISEDNPGILCIDDPELYRKGCAKSGAEFWSLLLIYYTVFLIYQITIGTLAWFYWRQIGPGNGVVLGRGINSNNNRQCTPEIPIGWSSSQPQSDQFGNNFSSPIYPNINLSYQESPPPYSSTIKDSHVHKI